MITEIKKKKNVENFSRDLKTDFSIRTTQKIMRKRNRVIYDWKLILKGFLWPCSYRVILSGGTSLQLCYININSCLNQKTRMMKNRQKRPYVGVVFMKNENYSITCFGEKLKAVARRNVKPLNFTNKRHFCFLLSTMGGNEAKSQLLLQH
jgi:hypothetical protein